MLPRSIAFYGAAACGAYALDMSQYANLFRSTRIPKLERDELRVAPHTSHVVVQRRGAFYKLPVLDADGGTLPLPELHAALQQIVDNADAKPAAVPGSD